MTGKPVRAGDRYESNDGNYRIVVVNVIERANGDLRVNVRRNRSRTTVSLPMRTLLGGYRRIAR